MIGAELESVYEFDPGAWVIPQIFIAGRGGLGPWSARALNVCALTKKLLRAQGALEKLRSWLVEAQYQFYIAIDLAPEIQKFSS